MERMSLVPSGSMPGRESIRLGKKGIAGYLSKSGLPPFQPGYPSLLRVTLRNGSGGKLSQAIPALFAFGACSLARATTRLPPEFGPGGWAGTRRKHRSGCQWALSTRFVSGEGGTGRFFPARSTEISAPHDSKRFGPAPRPWNHLAPDTPFLALPGLNPNG